MQTVIIRYRVSATEKEKLQTTVRQFIKAQAAVIPEASYTSIALDDGEYLHVAKFSAKEDKQKFQGTKAFAEFSGYLKSVADPKATVSEVLASTEDEVLDIVRTYTAAWTSRDLVSARKVLADDLQFRGSIDTFNTADDFLGGLTGFVNGLYKSFHLVSESVSQNTVQLFYKCKTNLGELRFSEIFTVANGKIATIDLVFDTAPFLNAK